MPPFPSTHASAQTARFSGWRPKHSGSATEWRRPASTGSSIDQCTQTGVHKAAVSNAGDDIQEQETLNQERLPAVLTDTGLFFVSGQPVPDCKAIATELCTAANGAFLGTEQGDACRGVPNFHPDMTREEKQEDDVVQLQMDLDTLDPLPRFASDSIALAIEFEGVYTQADATAGMRMAANYIGGLDSRFTFVKLPRLPRTFTNQHYDMAGELYNEVARDALRYVGSGRRSERLLSFVSDLLISVLFMSSPAPAPHQTEAARREWDKQTFLKRKAGWDQHRWYAVILWLEDYRSLAHEHSAYLCDHPSEVLDPDTPAGALDAIDQTVTAMSKGRSFQACLHRGHVQARFHQGHQRVRQAVFGGGATIRSTRRTTSAQAWLHAARSSAATASTRSRPSSKTRYEGSIPIALRSCPVLTTGPWISCCDASARRHGRRTTVS